MKVNEIIIVEGKTDTQVLKSFLDVDTIETGGSAISKETLDYIKTTSLTRDIIVMTDPDFPGNKFVIKSNKLSLIVNMLLFIKKMPSKKIK